MSVPPSPMCAMGLYIFYFLLLFFSVAEGARFVTNTPFSACTALFHCYCTTDLSIWCYGAVCNCGWQVHAIVSTVFKRNFDTVFTYNTLCQNLLAYGNTIF